MEMKISFFTNAWSSFDKVFVVSSLSFLISGMALLKERTSGTLNLLLNLVKRSER